MVFDFGNMNEKHDRVEWIVIDQTVKVRNNPIDIIPGPCVLIQNIPFNYFLSLCILLDSTTK